MPRPSRIGVDAALIDLPLWSKVDGREAIVRRLRFKDFATAFAFMTRVAAKAEAMDHHPEWSNTFDRLDIVLTTHDAGGVTALDVELAGFIDAAFSA
jgi:4a-hydroxytetrahydrobiopterin dehydratase